MATVHLECRSSTSFNCPSYGKQRSVKLEQVAIGVLARPEFICADCHMSLMVVSPRDKEAEP